MKRLFMFPAAAMLAATPLAAQDRPADPPGLQCAAWAAILVGQAPSDQDSTGLVALLGYFIGKYEGATGRELESDVLIELISRPGYSETAVQDTCLAEAEDLGERMQDVGQAMTDFAIGDASK